MYKWSWSCHVHLTEHRLKCWIPGTSGSLNSSLIIFHDNISLIILVWMAILSALQYGSSTLEWISVTRCTLWEFCTLRAAFLCSLWLRDLPSELWGLSYTMSCNIMVTKLNTKLTVGFSSQSRHWPICAWGKWWIPGNTFVILICFREHLIAYCS